LRQRGYTSRRRTTRVTSVSSSRARCNEMLRRRAPESVRKMGLLCETQRGRF
jgi:hypothetical protein